MHLCSCYNLLTDYTVPLHSFSHYILLGNKPLQLLYCACSLPCVPVCLLLKPEQFPLPSDLKTGSGSTSQGDARWTLNIPYTGIPSRFYLAKLLFSQFILGLTGYNLRQDFWCKYNARAFIFIRCLALLTILALEVFLRFLISIHVFIF